ncbi:hypothetical protein GCM10022224_070240 [Nonomuraea antimicrobica]|uniref:Uncharacterized protein n=1 Tax=Nonomuraea antimicrobica TaxID=561173 RepID=A0ABP7CTQ8_9ACTN
MRFSAPPTWPTSVRGSVSTSGTRARRTASPVASGSSETRAAVAASLPSGRTARRTNRVDAPAVNATPASVTAASTITSLVSVDRTSESGSPATSTSPSRVRVPTIR